MSKDEEVRIDDEAEETTDDVSKGQDVPEKEAVTTEELEIDPVQTLEERISRLEEENSSLKDQYLRKQADFENFRKRMVREKEEAIKFANSVLLLDIVSIIDDFERAIRSSEESRDFESFFSGIELIEKQFTGMLERKWGLTRFESKGELFDPEKHEAIMMEEADTESQIVLEDFMKGYMLHDRVLRHAKVKVSSPASSGTSECANDSKIDEKKEEKE